MLRLTGIPESAVEEIAAPIYTRHTNPVTTILAAPGEIQLHLKAFGATEGDALARLDDLLPQLETALREHVFSNDGASLEEVVGRGLSMQRATLAVAESCTGGLLAQRITAVPGSSSYFPGGLICYSNTMKEEWAGVPRSLVEAHGAVSREVALALAEGVRARGAATYGIGITGIAGPGGASPAKPVGLVYIALAGPLGADVQEKNYFGERAMVRWQASQTALDMLRRVLNRQAALSGLFTAQSAHL
jgi:nicotinamide-nucleotide amidase